MNTNYLLFDKYMLYVEKESIFVVLVVLLMVNIPVEIDAIFFGLKFSTKWTMYSLF